MSATSGYNARFGSLLVYAPSGKTPASLRAKDICINGVKKGRDRVYRRAAQRIAEDGPSLGLDIVMTSDSVLVPAPRSAPLVRGGLWPAERICRALVDAGVGREVAHLLQRTEAVPKAAYAKPADRPTVERHRQTLAVRRELAQPGHIVVVDDVVTQGAMLCACVSLLEEHYPTADVWGFALLRAMSGAGIEIEDMLDPCVGTITSHDGLRAIRRP